VAESGRYPKRTEALICSLYAEHGRSLLDYATRLTGNRAAAEDVVQETLVRAWKHADDLVEDKGSVRGWLLTVARRVVIDQARARSVRPAEVAQVDERTPFATDHSESVVTTLAVLDALDRLSLDHREVLVELYYRSRSMDEAAQSLGVPPGTVKSRSHHALTALRAVMGGGESCWSSVR